MGLMRRAIAREESERAKAMEDGKRMSDRVCVDTRDSCVHHCRRAAGT